MADDWKGEHLISAKAESKEKRKFTSASAASGIAHRRRQAMGCNQSRDGGPWAQAIKKFHDARKMGKT